MKIYTKTGDAGTTGLFGGGRVSKASDRVDAYGAVDELNSALGLARTLRFDDDVDALLELIQSELFTVGAELATLPGRSSGSAPVSDAEVAVLERAIDRWQAELPTLQSFVLPGGAEAAAHLHVARTVCRRAERRVVALAATEDVRGEVMRYLNRLGDLLFVLARLANLRAGIVDVPWKGRSARGGGGSS